MKPMVGVSVYAKESMVPWMVDGIKLCFPEARVHFHFETEKDRSCEVFQQVAKPSWTWSSDKNHRLEHGCHRLLIDEFLKSDCDYLIIPHDDNRFNDPGITGHIEALARRYGPNLGWVTGRDGYGYGYANIISSPFSSSDLARTKLKIGEFAPRMMLNTGPVIYSRVLIEQVGLPDPNMAWYWWDDYSLRSHNKGFVNGVLGMDCEHRKFGVVFDNKELYDGKLVAKGLAELNQRWRPILGRNPL